MKRVLTSTLTLLGCAWLLLSCTKEKEGVIDSPQNPPRLLSAGVQPTSMNLDSDTVNAVPLGGGMYQVTTNVSARALDADGLSDISLLSFSVFPPRSTSPTLNGSLQMTSSSADTAIYSSNMSFVTARSAFGPHTIQLSVRDNENLLSNVLFLTVNISRNNSPPQIFSLFAPDTVRRPNSGSRAVLFAITAADSDGLGDISSVFLKSPSSSNPNQEFPLFDDGALATSGDTLAGDGRYSTIIYVFPSFPLGTREFRFWARDNTSALSDSISHFITVVPE